MGTLGQRMSTLPATPRGPESVRAQAFLAALRDPIARLAREHGPVDFTLPSHGTVLSDPLCVR